MSVKTNPSEFVLRKIYGLGIKSFEVASISEVKLIRKFFKKSKIYFMNPVKPRHEIKEAYFNYGVKDFSYDSLDELKKIVESTNISNDLNLHLRVSIPNHLQKFNYQKIWCEYK